MNMEIVDKNSPEARSEDVVAENVRQLGELFPELLTEGPLGPSINVDVLKQLVGDRTVSEIDEKYGLSWFGKRDARKMALTPSLGTLLPRPEDSEGWGDTKNLMIEGDNLEVLKLLQKSYSGRVKLIYIDPPYNTGNDFVYPDDFSSGISTYLEVTGQIDSGYKKSTNSESGGRFHTEWLNMMFPRLKVARDLLSNDGFIAISIGQDEIANLIKLASEVFGPENFVSTITRVAKTTSNKGTYFAPSVDYVLIIAKTIDSLEPFSLPPGEEYERGFKGQDADGRKYKPVGLYQASLDPLRGCINQRYWIQCPDGSFCIPPGNVFPSQIGEAEQIPPSTSDDKVWRWSAASFLERREELVFKETSTSPLLDPQGKQSRWNVYVKQYLDRRMEEGILPRDFLDDMPNSKGTSALKKIGMADVFDYAKPPELIKWLDALIRNSDAIILDFFAGSGTTGQAVMEQNALDGGNRQFILVQLPEPLLEENKEQAAALAFCKEHNLEENIAALTAERLRRAGAKVRSENPMFAGDVGFRVFKLAESNIRAWNPLTEDLEGTLRTSEDHLVEGRSALDVLYEILLKRGLDLCIPIETKEIAGHHVNAVGGGVLFACLDSQIAQTDVETLAEGIVAWRKELSVVGDVNCIFRDSAFDNDVAKSNMSSILEQAGFTRIQSL